MSSPLIAFFSLLIALVSGTAQAETRCEWLEDLPKTPFDQEQVVACPNEVLEYVYWYTNGIRRKSRTYAQMGSGVWRSAKSPYATDDPCATGFVHHSDGQPMGGLPEDVRSRWTEPDPEVQEFNAFLTKVGTPECDIKDPKYGYWCHLLADAPPTVKPLEEEGESCLTADLEDLYQCFPKRRSVTAAYLAEQTNKMLLLEWLLIHRVGFDPARQYLISLPQVSTHRRELNLVAKYRICTRD